MNEYLTMNKKSIINENDKFLLPKAKKELKRKEKAKREKFNELTKKFKSEMTQLLDSIELSLKKYFNKGEEYLNIPELVINQDWFFKEMVGKGSGEKSSYKESLNFISLLRKNLFEITNREFTLEEDLDGSVKKSSIKYNLV
jgi:hypothetical protein